MSKRKEKFKSLNRRTKCVPRSVYCDTFKSSAWTHLVRLLKLIGQIRQVELPAPLVFPLLGFLSLRISPLSAKVLTSTRPPSVCQVCAGVGGATGVCRRASR